MKNYLFLAAACSVLIGCGSSGSPTTDSTDVFEVPTELLGSWSVACSEDASSGYQIETINFAASTTTYTLNRFTDEACEITNVENPGRSSSGAARFGDVITTTNGVDAREWDHINDMVNDEVLDPTVTSYNIYYVLNDVLYHASGGTEEERPDTLDFNVEWVKQ